ncbi:MAG: ATP-dependent DNA helicase [Deltaproteobacteria bacterium]|nr:ATP-dependent DNA helicase [Deltaproteobacteria bacterium]
MSAPARDTTLERLLGPEGIAARAHGAWELRDAQLSMAKAVLSTLTGARGSRVLAVEAPTGVGKTLAYLCAAAVSGRTVLVATNTKTQEQQIADKDLPFLARLLPELGMSLVEATPVGPEAAPGRVRFAVMKGRGNYLCLHRLGRRLRERPMALFSEDPLDRIAAWSETTRTGDRAELSELPDDGAIWRAIDARSEACVGTACSLFERCFVVRMKRSAANADLVIANHHLVLSDLALEASSRLRGGPGLGRVVPRADALVLDEAHALEEAACAFFGGELTEGRIERLVADTESYAATLMGPGLSLNEAARHVARTASRVFRALPGEGPDDERRSFTRDDPALDPARREAEEAEAALLSLAERLGDPNPVAKALARRAEACASDLLFTLGAKDSSLAYFSERARGALGAVPVEVGPILEETLFGSFPRVVLTSATLSTGRPEDPHEGFEFFLTGIGAPDHTHILELTSPFDLAHQAALYLPSDLPEPDQPGYFEASTDRMEALIELVGGGAFLLFTSHRALNAAHTRLAPRLRHPVLAQGQAPKPELLRRFVERAPAVLFATASFWEGVDVPGDPLRLVVVDRLPFASPSDPLVRARIKRLEERGENPFASFQLPKAVLRLKQAFGRLIRSRTDRGIVAVLDARISRRAYGHAFVSALAEPARLTSLPALEDWWQGANL